MGFYNAGLIWKSELTNKYYQDLEAQDKLVILDKQKPIVGATLYSHRMLTNFNSNYLEFLDQWDKYRGFYNFVLPALICLGLFGISAVIYGLSVMPLSEGFWMFFFFGMILLAFGALNLGMFYTASKVYNTYIYFPIRFHRERREVYVLGTDHKARTFAWDDLHVAVFHQANNQYSIALLDVAEDGLIRYGFCLPFQADIEPNMPFLLGHWEFVRRYMDGNPQNCFNAIREYYPAFGRKETFKESIYLSVFRYGYDDDEDIQSNIDTINIHAIAIPIFGMDTIGRFLNKIFNKVPVFPPEIEEKCQVAPDDALDIQKSDIPTQRTLNLTIGQKIGVLIRLSLGVFLALGMIDAIGAYKGQSVFGWFG